MIFAFCFFCAYTAYAFCFNLATGVLEMGSLQLCADQEGESQYCRSRLKIRRAPSCKISAAFAAVAACSDVSFHGSCRPQDANKKGCTTSTPMVSQPLIYHTFEPAIIETEPEEFMSVVQRLTGSPQTRRLLRESSRKRREKGLSAVQVPDMCAPDEPSQKRQETESSTPQLPDMRGPIDGVGSMSVQPDPLKEGRIIILTPTTLICCTSDLPLSAPTSPNHSDISKSTTHKPQLPSVNHQLNPLAAPLLSDTKQLNPNPNHPPLSSISATLPSASNYQVIHPVVTSSSDTKQLMLKSNRPPLSSTSADLPPANHLLNLLAAPSLSNAKQPNLKPNRPYLLPISANYANSDEKICAYASSLSSNSPLSPNSSLTTSSEGYLSNRDEGGASSYRELAEEEEEEEGNRVIEEDGSFNFFVFSGDSYYGNFSNADHDEVDHLLL